MAAFALLAAAVLAMAWWIGRDPALAGRSRALTEAAALERALAARGQVWREELLEAVFAGSLQPPPRLLLRWDEAGRLTQPQLAPAGRERGDDPTGEGAESFTPARAWLARTRDASLDAAAALDAARQGFEALQPGERATAARLRLAGAQAALRAGLAEDAAGLLAELTAEVADDETLDGASLALLAGHRLADALEAGGDPAAARLTREDLRQRLLAAAFPVPAADWERELRFLHEADGDGDSLSDPELRACAAARAAEAAAARLAEDPSRDGFTLGADAALLDPERRRGALFAGEWLRASLVAAWSELLPAGRAWEIAPPEAVVAAGSTAGALAAPAGLGGGWRLLLTRPEVYVDEFARSQRLLQFGAVLVAVAMLAVGLIGRRALLRQAQLERMRADFVAGVSHELRTPAASLALLAENLAEGRVEGEERRREYYGALQRDARRMQRLVADVLDASRLEREAFRVEPAPCDPAALLLRAAEEHRPRFADAGMALELDAPESLSETPLDEDAVERALANLLENARKYAASGCGAVLRARAEDGRLRVEVEDRGPGVAPEWRERIFAPFERGPGGTALSAGAGLGLALVRATAEAHGGRAWVESGADGVGARFVLVFPCSPQGAD